MAVYSSVLQHESVWLSDFFHRFPHVDFSFRLTNATFQPESTSYRESLEFWCAVPVVWCVLLWLAFLIFFCLRCCCKVERKQKKALCSRLCIGLFLLLGCGALGAGLYGNEEAHAGVQDFVDAVVATNRTVENAFEVVSALDNVANDLQGRDAKALQNAVISISNVTVREMISDYISQIKTNVAKVSKDITSVKKQGLHVNTEAVVNVTDEVEKYRWISTVTVYSAYFALFALVFTGLLKKSKRILIASSALSILCMAFMWILTSAYLAASVGMGDLCADPDTFVISQVKKQVEIDILEAYITCSDKSKPFQEDILDSQTLITQAIVTLNTTVNLTAPFHIDDKIAVPVSMIRQDLRLGPWYLSSLLTSVGTCDTINNMYVQAVNSICYTTVIGAGFLVLFSAVVGLCSTFIVIFAACTWPYLGRSRERSRGYTPVDDTDPFLPGPPPYINNYGSIGTPSSAILNANGSSSNIQAQGYRDVSNEDRRLMNGRPVAESPPPSYHPGHYMEQYFSLAPRPNSISPSS
ncbi:LOW QUALITY PROTEIN: protein tweety homolog 2-like [Pomacea canaliculata]|uniref:LOW QUALITY PROTEIN: protein tweety homolog 2-like n=1 Tax=Pomacea canaliculata TaxID=400727 RepID=UPI000D72690F|nr:LOW QUALITY PROTEIN: protein tweety homolog 2-like [Pomacea canaliculata]